MREEVSAVTTYLLAMPFFDSEDVLVWKERVEFTYRLTLFSLTRFPP